MKIKTKLWLGFGFLFTIVLLFGALSIYYIQRISNNAKVILKDNYETLSYTREMRTLLDETPLPLNEQASRLFNVQLVKEEHNITEKGEGEAVTALRKSFEKLSLKQGSMAEQQTTERQARAHLRNIEALNMQAIVRKNDAARASVNQAGIIMGLAGAFTFLVLFSFSVNFPGFIANPLRSLLEGIREISEKNYRKRLHFDEGDEFGEVANAFNDMAIRLNEWENSNVATILSEKRRIETIIEQMQDAIVGVNENHEILFINSSARKVLNLTDGKVVGQNTTALEKNNDLFRSILSNTSAVKLLKIVLDGQESYFQLQSRDIYVPNLVEQSDAIKIASKSAGKVYLLRNVTEFKERDEAKTNFIATISHELKTPISSIKMSLKLLNDSRIGSMNSEQQQLIEHIADDTSRLLKITSELLELSQVETGNIQLNFIPVDPEQILDYAINSVKFQAKQKSVQLDIVKNNKLPQVQADVEKTAWVLINFLSNALRYSAEKSKIIIKLNLQSNRMVFSVTDFGKGIDEQYKKRLFDRYFQVPTDGQNKSGSGLGLAISKDFIEAQQGRIWVESALGEGSTFYFSLPIARANGNS
jgi:NtrC-family two-component system sensor histidine kinase KinB